MAPNTKDTEEERHRKTQRGKEAERQTEGERDSENNSTSYSFSWSAYHVLDSLLDPETMDILILAAKAQLVSLIIVASYNELRTTILYWHPNYYA